MLFGVEFFGGDMGKVLLYQELNIKKCEHVLYSETYEVRFWIKVGKFWKQKEVIYHAKTKSEHKSVGVRWINDYKGQEVKLIGIYYQ